MLRATSGNALETEHWMILVTVGLDSTKVRVSVKPEDTIGLLLRCVTAECGKIGTLFNSTGELQLTDTVLASGLSDQAVVHLEIEDPFTTDQSALIAVRDHFNIQDAGWGRLEEFTEPKQLAECFGVEVGADGRVTVLDLSASELTGEKPGHC
jgi:hypothetical protein